MITASASGLTGDGELPPHGWSNNTGEQLRRRGRTQQSGQQHIMGKSGQEQITLELITELLHRCLEFSARIQAGGGDKRIVFVDPSFTGGDYNAGDGGARAMYPKEYKNIVSWEKEYCIS